MLHFSPRHLNFQKVFTCRLSVNHSEVKSVWFLLYSAVFKIKGSLISEINSCRLGQTKNTLPPLNADLLFQLIINIKSVRQKNKRKKKLLKRLLYLPERDIFRTQITTCVCFLWIALTVWINFDRRFWVLGNGIWKWVFTHSCYF